MDAIPELTNVLLCAITYENEISLTVTLHYQYTKSTNTHPNGLHNTVYSLTKKGTYVPIYTNMYIMKIENKIIYRTLFTIFGYPSYYTYCHLEIVPFLLECQEALVLN